MVYKNKSCLVWQTRTIYNVISNTQRMKYKVILRKKTGPVFYRNLSLIYHEFLVKCYENVSARAGPYN